MDIPLDESASFHREGLRADHGEGKERVGKARAFETRESPRCERCEVIQRSALSLAILVAGGILVVAFGDRIQDFEYDALIGALRQTSATAIGLSFFATAMSFAALVGRDLCALRYIRRKPPLAAVLLASFCGSALGNAVGLGGLTGGAVRYRIYGAVGINADEIARLMIFIAVGFGLGLAGVGGFSGIVGAAPVAELLEWPTDLVRVCAGFALAAAVGVAVIAVHGEARVGRFCLPAPSKTLVAIQFLVTLIRLTSAAAALWVLLPDTSIGFLSFAAIFAAATALGAVSHIPGGFGIFELVVLWAFRAQGSSGAVAAALLVYRGVYYVLPLILSAAFFAFFEFRIATGKVRHAGRDPLAAAAARLSPSLMAVMTFATGVMLLVSGATPAFGNRLQSLSLRLPLWSVEASHFFGSLMGVVFLFVARGLFARRDGAWWLALVLATLSLVFSLLKGLAYGEAAFLAVFIVFLLASRRQFDRPASILSRPFTLTWLIAIGAILAASFWILFFAFHNEDYAARDLWWQFEFDAQAPRALRALVGASVFAIALALWGLLRPPAGAAAPADAAVLSQAKRVIGLQDRSDVLLALMGDKSFLFSASRLSFVMFGKRGRSWIALFDPVGPRSEWPELIGRFVALADAHGGRAAFYQVRPESLPLYLDAGLTVMKLGEDARVRLASFKLEGGDRAHLRYALRRGEREGLSFEFVPPDQTASQMEVLDAISGEWLEERGGREKGFSVAAFEPNYVASQGVGVVRECGAPVAFATVMIAPQGGEATIGLMRHRRELSAYAMEFLFTRLILTLKELALETLSLGMAPLSGLQPAPLSSRWHLLGSLIWRHGDRFYNFQGLRVFKGKFHPVWEPRYLAASGTVGPFVALADAAALIKVGPTEGGATDQDA
jgi:phosphatidylglycerol lysyltransferase